MTRNTKMVRFACALVMTFATIGCNAPDASSSQATGQVRGKVTARGKPLAKSQLSFTPSDVDGKSPPVVSTEINENGTFEVTTVVGQTYVTLAGPDVGKTPQLPYYSKTIHVKPGSNEFNIALP